MAGILPELSQAMAEMVANASGFTVSVDARKRLPATGVVWSEDGVVVTSHHVVRRDEDIRVVLPSGDTTPATLLGRDPMTDLAVLKTNATGLTVPTWADTADVRVGNLVLALGRPGADVQATLGVVSALEREWRGHGGSTLDTFFQTDVVMYPGFSGGPLVGAGGAVLGLNTSALMRGISLTIPTHTIQRVVGSLVEHGKIRRGFLGVTVQPVRLPDDVAEEAGQRVAVMTVSVEKDGPASSGGLAMGDVILTLDSHKVTGPDELLGLLTGDRVGSTVTVQIMRGGEMQSMEVTIGERS